MNETIYLSVVIPIRNEEAHIGATLRELVCQDYPNDRYELIVVDGRSTDRTRAVVERFMGDHPDINMRLLDNPGCWSSRGRNLGIRAAKGRLIAVIDGHVHIPSDALFSSMEHLKETNNVLCLARPAPLLVPNLRSGMPLWIALARRCWLGHSRNSHIYSEFQGLVDPMSSGFAYDGAVFSRVGYFDEAFDAAEDVEFHYRLKCAGVLAYTSPKLTINSYPRATLRGLFHQMVRYGVGRARLVRKHRGALTKETLVPPAILLFFAALPVALSATMWMPMVVWLYAVLFALYWVILSAAGCVESAQHGRLLPGLLIALAVWTTHMGLGWGFLMATVLPRNRLLPMPPVDGGAMSS